MGASVLLELQVRRLFRLDEMGRTSPPGTSLANSQHPAVSACFLTFPPASCLSLGQACLRLLLQLVGVLLLLRATCSVWHRRPRKNPATTSTSNISAKFATAIAATAASARAAAANRASTALNTSAASVGNITTNTAAVTAPVSPQPVPPSPL